MIYMIQYDTCIIHLKTMILSERCELKSQSQLDSCNGKMHGQAAAHFL